MLDRDVQSLDARPGGRGIVSGTGDGVKGMLTWYSCSAVPWLVWLGSCVPSWMDLFNKCTRSSRLRISQEFEDGWGKFAHQTLSKDGP